MAGIDIGAAQVYISSGLYVTPSDTNLTIAVSSGNIASKAYGSVLAVPAQTLTVSEPDETDERIDYIVVDPTNGVVSIVEGTPSDSAQAPEIPSTQMPVATVTIPADVTNLAEATVVDIAHPPLISAKSST